MTFTTRALSNDEGTSDRRDDRPEGTPARLTLRSSQDTDSTVGASNLTELRGFRKDATDLGATLSDGEDCCGIVGISTGMREVKRRVGLFAQHTAPVLITGETGTGKEMVSRALHQLGPRARRPFVPIACGAIPSGLAESELFGHERGAFTGAIGQRLGAFERADGGTLLLDDVDDLPLGLQVKLLRALEEQSFLRVGGSREISVTVRVIATSKASLAGEVSDHRFRPDLYFRLRALELRLPALREREEDVLLLAEHFLRKFASRHAGTGLSLGPEAAALLRHYEWPGNVRELRHAIESTVIVSKGERITAECLPDFLHSNREGGVADLFTPHLAGQANVSFNAAVQAFEDGLIRWAMQRANGRQSKAAEILGLPRTTLQSKLCRTGGS